jgi:hypothetical protein
MSESTPSTPAARPRRSDRSLRIARIVAVLTGLICLGFCVEMMRRVARFHDEVPRQIFAFQRVILQSFSFAGRDVVLEDDLSNPEQPFVVVRYGSDELRLRVTIPGNPVLPPEVRHADWMRVMRFIPAAGMTVEEAKRKIDTGEIPDRLVIVTRTPRAGVDPQTWGSVWKRDWEFDFYEFLPEGGFRRERLSYPTARGARQPRPGELQENTWQLQAALHLMPQAGAIGPTRNFSQDGLSAAGWTLPLAAFSGLVCAIAIAFSLRPREASRFGPPSS